MTSPEMKDPITLPREVVERAASLLRRVLDGRERQVDDGSTVMVDLPPEDAEKLVQQAHDALRQSLASAPQPVEDGVEVCPECHGAGCDMCSNGFIPTFPQANAKASAPQVGGEWGGGDVIARIDPSRWDHPGAPQLSYANGRNDALAALSQEAEAVAWQWRYKDAEQWQFVHHRHALDLSRDPRCVVRRLIVHPSDRGGEVKG